mgnify:FL=1
MGENDSEDLRPLATIERVRCLGCSASYVKPAGGGTVSANPGCPECGYVGWVLEEVRPDGAPNRFFSGRPRRRTG